LTCTAGDLVAGSLPPPLVAASLSIAPACAARWRSGSLLLRLRRRRLNRLLDLWLRSWRLRSAANFRPSRRRRRSRRGLLCLRLRCRRRLRTTAKLSARLNLCRPLRWRLRLLPNLRRLRRTLRRWCGCLRLRFRLAARESFALLRYLLRRPRLHRRGQLASFRLSCQRRCLPDRGTRRLRLTLP
jgi:hypothetical protein